MKKVGIIGCGAIGSLIAEAFEKRIVRCDQLALFDRNSHQAESLKASMGVPVRIVANVDEMITLKPLVIVGAASQQAVREYARSILAADIDLIVMSVGALLDLNLKSNRIHVPSGAIGGLDAFCHRL